MSARLAEVDALPHEAVGQILEGITCCSIVGFRDMHKLLSTTKRICQIHVAEWKRDSSIAFAAIKKLCSKASEFFHVLNLLNKWNIPQGHWHNATIISCYNLRAPDHTSDKCPQPRNEAKITKAKENFARANADGCGGRDHGRGAGRGSGRGGKGGTNLWHNPCGKWGDKGALDAATNKSGVEKINGKWKMNCKSCGWNLTHTTDYYGEWWPNQSTFQLPATHVSWSKSGAPPAASTPAPPATNVGGGALSRGQLSSLINRHKTETEDGAFVFFLSEFEGLLN